MLGAVLEMGGFIAAAYVRGGVRKNLFRSMLRRGLVKGVSRKSAAEALRKGGGKWFSRLYKQNRKQIGTYVRDYNTLGDDFILGSLSRAGRRFGTKGIGRKAFNKAGRELALGASRYNTLGGIGGAVLGIGMLGMGIDLASAGTAMGEEMPVPSEEIQNANMYIMPRQAYTQRQRAMQAISMTQLGLRSAFGQEARYMHQ